MAEKVNSDLLSHLQQRLDEALDEADIEGADESTEEKRRKSPERTQRKLKDVDYSPRPSDQEKGGGGQKAASQDSGIQRLLGFFEQKLSDPIYSDEDMYRRRKELYAIFEESIHRSLIATKRTQEYDDFAELTVLYFITDADEQGYTVEEINNMMKEVS